MAEKRYMASSQEPSVPSQPTAGPAMYHQPAQQQQQPPTIVVQVRPQPHKRYDNFAAERSRSLGITQIVCGVMAFILNAVGLAILTEADRSISFGYNYNDYPDYPVDGVKIYSYGHYYWKGSAGIYASSGIWCPIFLFVSGSLAIAAAKRPTKCLVVSCLVMTIISTVMAIIMFAMATLAMGEDATRLSKGFEYTVTHDGYVNDTHFKPDPPSEQKYNNDAEKYAKACIPVSVLFFFVSIVVVVVTIWSCVICGNVLCCADEPDNDEGAVRYLPHQGQILVLDRYGRPIPDAQVIQIPTVCAGQSTGQVITPALIQSTGQVQGTFVPQNPPPYTSGDGNGQTGGQNDQEVKNPLTGKVAPPPPYQ